jgi:hypothetical protein
MLLGKRNKSIRKPGSVSLTDAKKPRGRQLRRWIGCVFVLWAVFVAVWVANSYRTRGVSGEMLRSGPELLVIDGAAALEFLPRSVANKSALIFVCGSGVAASAYAPLLRPVAEAGHPVFIVKLPYRFAAFESHKQAAIDHVSGVIAAHPEISRWVVSGHSLGGALACRAVKSRPKDFSAMVLIGTTHPKEDMSALLMPVTKAYATNDRVASLDRMFANKRLLPASTRWVEIKGGNHSQFGRYGHQLLDGKATISREAQEAATRAVILEVLNETEQ